MKKLLIFILCLFLTNPAYATRINSNNSAKSLGFLTDKYVPYLGANKDVDLGSNKLSVGPTTARAVLGDGTNVIAGKFTSTSTPFTVTLADEDDGGAGRFSDGGASVDVVLNNASDSISIGSTFINEGAIRDESGALLITSTGGLIDFGDDNIITTGKGAIGTGIDASVPFVVKRGAGGGSVGKFFVDDSLGVIVEVANSDQGWAFGLNANENFVFRDVTNSKDTFVIEPDPPSSALYLRSNGNFGIASWTSSGNRFEIFTDARVSRLRLKDSGTFDLELPNDNQKIRLGVTQGDFDLYSDGTDGRIDTSGDLKIDASGGDVDFADNNLTTTGDITIGDHTASSEKVLNLLGGVNVAAAARINFYEGANSGGFINYDGSTNKFQIGVQSGGASNIGIDIERNTGRVSVPNSTKFIFGETTLQEVWVYGETGTGAGAKLYVIDDDTVGDATGEPIGGFLHWNVDDILYFKTTDGSSDFSHFGLPRDSQDTRFFGNVIVGGTTPDSLFEVDGAEGLAIETVTGNTTLDTTHSTLLVNASGNVIITLPTSASAYNNTDGIGRIYTVKKIDADADTVSLDPNGSEEFEFTSASTVITTQGESITFQTNGTAWYIL